MIRAAIGLLMVALLAGCLHRAEMSAVPQLIEYGKAEQEAAALEMIEHCVKRVDTPMLCQLITDYGKTRRALCRTGAYLEGTPSALMCAKMLGVNPPQ